MISANLEKTFKKEYKELTKNLKIEKHENLTYRISPVKVKSSMEKSIIKENPVHQFTPEFEDFLIDFRKYLVEDVKELTVEFDPKTKKREQDNFKKTWSNYFSREVMFETKTINSLRKRIFRSIFGGFMLLLLCIAFALLAFFYETRQALQITYIVLNNLLFTLSWVFIWQGVSFWAYEFGPRKKKRKNLLIMYKAKFKTGKTYYRYKKEKANDNIDPVSMIKK